MKVSSNTEYFKKLTTFFLVGVIVSVTGLTACKDDPAGSETDITVTAEFAADPDEPKAGETVTLNAEASSVSEGSPEFSWTLATPAGSDAEIDNPGSVTASFEVDVAGDYDVSLTVSSGDASDSATLSITALPPVEEISGSISEDMTLTSNLLYIVVGDLTVNNGATLTIEPGTILEFESDVSMEIVSDARLSAIGTEQDSIFFTGTQKNNGYWAGLYFQNAAHPDNQLEYVVMEYAGSRASHGSTEPANLVLGRTSYNARVSVNNSVFRYSGGLGLFIHSNGSMPDSGNNTFTENESGAAGVFTSGIHNLNSSSDFSGNLNENDYVWVEGNRVTEDVTWQALNVPYAVKGSSDVQDAELTIDAGAEFAFDAESELVFGNGSITQALGTDDNPIRFTGLTETPGWWKGIQFRNTTHPDNLLDNVIVEYAGGEAFHGSTEPANLTLGRTSYDARVTVKNSTFQYSGGVGLFVHTNGDMDGSENNTYTNNADGPVELPTSKAHYLDSGSTFTGNTEDTDYAWVNGNTLAEDATWQPLDVPYGMKGTSEIDAELIIEPGSEFAFDTEASLIFDSESIVNVTGTEDEGILFTGTRQTPGWWNGIHVRGTEHPDNTMEYVTIEYGGGESFHSSVEAANLAIGRTSYTGYLSVTNSIIRESDNVGIYVNSNSEGNADICSDNEFADNGSDNCVESE